LKWEVLAGQLNVVLLAVQRLLGFGLYGDDASRHGYLQLEVGITGMAMNFT
jgi:hypothetical protein